MDGESAASYVGEVRDRLEEQILWPQVLIGTYCGVGKDMAAAGGRVTSRYLMPARWFPKELLGIVKLLSERFKGKKTPKNASWGVRELHRDFVENSKRYWRIAKEHKEEFIGATRKIDLEFMSELLKGIPDGGADELSGLVDRVDYSDLAGTAESLKNISFIPYLEIALPHKGFEDEYVGAVFIADRLYGKIKMEFTPRLISAPPQDYKPIMEEFLGGELPRAAVTFTEDVRYGSPEFKIFKDTHEHGVYYLYTGIGGFAPHLQRPGNSLVALGNQSQYAFLSFMGDSCPGWNVLDLGRLPALYFLKAYADLLENGA